MHSISAVASSANRRPDSQKCSFDTNSSSARFQVGIGAITGIIPAHYESEVTAIISNLDVILRDKTVLSLGMAIKKGKMWQHHGFGAAGSFYTWNLPGDYNDSGSVRISFNDEVLSRGLPTVRSRIKFVRFLTETYGFKATRIDISIDDFDKGLKFDEIGEACENKNFFGFKDYLPLGGYGKPMTFQLGSRESARYIRIYDKNAESNGQIDAVRFELEAKRELAQAIQKFLMGIDLKRSDDEIAMSLAFQASAGINFVTSKQKNQERCETCHWWADWIRSFICDCELQITRSKPCLEKSRRNIEERYATTLAMLYKVFGQSWLNKVIVNGESRLGSKHYAMMSANNLEKMAIVS